MTTRDCNHTALRIEPDRYRCSGCGIEFERKSVADHIVAMRAVLRQPRAKPEPEPAEPKPPPPPIPRTRP